MKSSIKWLTLISKSANYSSHDKYEAQRLLRKLKQKVNKYKKIKFISENGSCKTICKYLKVHNVYVGSTYCKKWCGGFKGYNKKETRVKCSYNYDNKH